MSRVHEYIEHLADGCSIGSAHFNTLDGTSYRTALENHTESLTHDVIVANRATVCLQESID